MRDAPPPEELQWGAKFVPQIQNSWLLGYLQVLLYLFLDTYKYYFISSSNKTSRKNSKLIFLYSSLFMFRFEKCDSSEFFTSLGGGTAPLVYALTNQD